MVYFCPARLCRVSSNNGWLCLLPHCQRSSPHSASSRIYHPQCIARSFRLPRRHPPVFVSKLGELTTLPKQTHFPYPRAMRILRDEDQHVAGPSSRPYVYQSIPVPTVSLRPSIQCSTSCPFLDTFPADPIDARKPQVTQAAMRRLNGSKLKNWEVTRRQENEGDLHGSSSSTYNESVASTFTSDYYPATTASFTNSSYSYNPSSTSTYSEYNASTSLFNASEPYYTSNRTSTSIWSSKTSSTHSTSTKQAYTPSFTSLWSYSASKKTDTATASKSTSSAYVPGVVLNMTMGGTSDTQAVYSVEMAFGHDDDNSRRKRAFRKGALYEEDGSTQYVNLQVDLGSSDMVNYVVIFQDIY